MFVWTTKRIEEAFKEYMPELYQALKVIDNSLLSSRRDKIIKIREQLDVEKDHQFFMCESGCTRTKFERAMEVGCVCPHCGSRMDLRENSHIIKQLENQLKEIERTFGQ